MNKWVAILAAALFLPTASAQIASWQDASADVVIDYRPTENEATHTQIPNLAGWYPQFDILRAGVYEETENEITLEILLSSAQGTGTEPMQVDTLWYDLYFTYNDESRRIRVESFGGFFDFAYLQHEESGFWNYDQFIWTERHPDGAGWLLPIRKLDFRDSNQVPVHAGSVLEEFWTESNKASFFGGVQDLCPDTFPQSNSFDCGMFPYDSAGTASSPLGSYELTIDPEGLGTVLLEVERPLRASNGLATTYVYSMRAINIGEETDEVRLSAGAMPDGWNVLLPKRIVIEPGEAKEFKAAVSIPFGHKHGETLWVDIRAVSEHDPTSESLQTLYVMWPEIAQPSGHHPSLYIHSDGGWSWINTASEDPNADGSGTAGPNFQFSCAACVTVTDPTGGLDTLDATWFLNLRPGLFTGLDFDITKPIVGSFDISLRYSMDVELSLDLYLYRENDPAILVAQDLQALSFSGGLAQTVNFNMAVRPEADRVPYEQYMTLAMIIRVVGESTPEQFAENRAADGTSLTSGFGDSAQILTSTARFDLPLLDYHDEVDPELLDAFTRLVLKAPDDVGRPVNAGKTAAFEFILENRGKNEDTVAWSIEGPLADWATVVPGKTDVKGGKNATVAIRVDVPSDAAPGQAADLLLVGQSTKDAEAQVFARFVAYVTDSEEIRDEGWRFDEIKSDAKKSEAKGAPMPLLLAPLALLLALRRRL